MDQKVDRKKLMLLNRPPPGIPMPAISATDGNGFTQPVLKSVALNCECGRDALWWLLPPRASLALGGGGGGVGCHNYSSIGGGGAATVAVAIARGRRRRRRRRMRHRTAATVPSPPSAAKSGHDFGLAPPPPPPLPRLARPKLVGAKLSWRRKRHNL